MVTSIVEGRDIEECPGRPYIGAWWGMGSMSAADLDGGVERPDGKSRAGRSILERR
jgi:hypothetical protein